MTTTRNTMIIKKAHVTTRQYNTTHLTVIWNIFSVHAILVRTSEHSGNPSSSLILGTLFLGMDLTEALPKRRTQNVNQDIKKPPQNTFHQSQLMNRSNSSVYRPPTSPNNSLFSSPFSAPHKLISSKQSSYSGVHYLILPVGDGGKPASQLHSSTICSSKCARCSTSKLTASTADIKPPPLQLLHLAHPIVAAY